jgi:hypothetical protein
LRIIVVGVSMGALRRMRPAVSFCFERDMTLLLLSFLLLFTIIVAFVLGIALAYWAVCGILYFFNPARTQGRPTRRPSFVPSPSGD